MTLDGIVGGIGPFAVLHHLQYLAERPFWGAPLSDPPPCACFLGMRSTVLGAVAALALLARAFSLYFSTKSFLIFSRSWSITRGNSGTVLCIRLYWFLHATGRCDKMILARVASVNETLPISVVATAKRLFLMIGRIPKYLFSTSI
jgi:hypothetical protein